MQVILTHEHADFDAVASLVGLARLVPEAVPVLPIEINENVSDFLTLYGGQLGVRRRADLRRTRVEHAWLVDTRNVQHVRGMTADTRRSVVDHHLDEEDDAARYTHYEVAAVGATATLIVERMAERDMTPEPVVATLLTLGIYEDTGALTYAGTTARDLRAAAWLLERGADLEVVARFLRHPLSEAGRALYRALLDAAEVIEHGGHRIVVAAAAAPDFEGEVATIAGKITELLEPAAVFVLVRLDGYIQLVARSVTDGIDAGAVAEALGGGGHARAAAAVIRHTDLARALEELRTTIPDAVQAVSRVGQIMSRGPVRSLGPEQTVRQALEDARRYGHEGFPVVEDGNVLGVVTRRDLDRAAHHNLGGAPVHRLLGSRPPQVTPDCSVETLQHVMTEHDLGQVPVIEDGQLVGIVTRTDLLKLWTERSRPGPRAKRRVDVAAGLDPDHLDAVERIADIARQRGEGVFLVGGLPRDLVLGAPRSPDVDIVVEGDAEALARAVAEQHGGRVRAHRRFGTAKWTRDDVTIDLVSARTEYYAAPSALPGVERGSLRSDLRRRDFTINTLAVDLHPARFGEIIDLFNGLADLEAGRIRVLHSLSFVEDPTRILRAVRLATRLEFEIEARTAELIPDAVGLIERVSGARLLAELRQLFAEPDPAAALRWLDQIGVLEEIAPGLSAGARVDPLMTALPATWAFWHRLLPDVLAPGPSADDRLALWLAEQGQPGRQAAERLRLPGDERATANAVRALWSDAAILDDRDAAPSAVYHALERTAADVLALGWTGAVDPVLRRQLRAYGERLAHVEAHVDGHDLEALGLAPGPRYSEILRTVLDAQLDGQVDSRAQALGLAAALVDATASVGAATDDVAISDG